MKIGDLVKLKRTVYHSYGKIMHGTLGIVINEFTVPHDIPGCCTVQFAARNTTFTIQCHNNELDILNEAR
tara:strand:+ start:4321 stop:4530 length:210 start_codon:yes stop_codon:yes gene_type:complete